MGGVAYNNKSNMRCEIEHEVDIRKPFGVEPFVALCFRELENLITWIHQIN